MREVIIDVESPVSLNFYNSGIDVIPVITVSDHITGTWNDNDFSLNEGTYEPVELKIQHGNNIIETIGNASLKIEYLNKRL